MSTDSLSSCAAAPGPGCDPSGSLDLSVVVACYNEQEVLPELHRRVAAVCADSASSCEIVLVDDGSRDDTWSVMQALSAADGQVVLVKLSRNHGHQLALTAGLSVCRGHRVLIIDADLQDPPELLPAMLQKMQTERADVVYGKRLRREGESIPKRFTAFLFYRFIRAMTETSIPVDTGDFRLISRRALAVLLAMPERHRFIRGMVSWIGFRQVPLEYERQKRVAGQTKYPFRKMFRFALDAVTGFSVKPLTLATWVGLFGAVASLGILAYALFGWIRGGTQPGWTSILGGFGLISSIQLLVLGIIGEYLGRLYEQSKGRPLFIIENIVRRPEGGRAAALPTDPARSTATADR